MARKKRRKRHIPKFVKYYKKNSQDEPLIDYEWLLQKIHSKIANILFPDLLNFSNGDWRVDYEGLTLFVDPVFGNQIEIQGTSNMPLLKRVTIHIGLLKLLSCNMSILEALKHCKKEIMTH